MLKKFVPLSADASPSKNPYEVRTFIGDNNSTTPNADWAPTSPPVIRKCPPNNTIAKILTIEDEIRRVHERTQNSRFQKPFKAFCTIGDDFLACIVPQRTTEELKTHSVMREYYLRAKRNVDAHVHHAEYRTKPGKFIRLDSPAGVTEEEEQRGEEEGEEETEGGKSVKPELATPTCSLDAIYAPTDRLLDLTMPTSGWFHNETDRPQVEDDGIDYSTYDPRTMQQRLDRQDLPRYDLIEGKTPLDLWTWNIGLQERDSDLDRDKKDATVLKFDCNNLELKHYKVPRDLHKTFRVVIVFGNDAVPKQKESINKDHFNRPLEIASIYVAFVNCFHLNPDFWKADSMDDILQTARNLVNRSEALNYKSKDTEFDILRQITEKDATIGIKVHFSGPIKSDPNIYKALTLYFSKFNSGILISKNLYLLIWKRCSNSFYIFDPNGRNENCIRDWEYGKCSLISVHFIEHLVHLILRYSKAQYMCDFHLYEIFLINYGKITIPPPAKPYPKHFHRMWTVVNSTFALIPSKNTGLQQPITGKEQNASMIISLLALLYSDVERAQSWTPDVLDDLHKFGATYFKHLCKRLRMKIRDQLNIVDLPDHLMMGAYKANLVKRPFLYTGNIADVITDHKDSQLSACLKAVFVAGKWEALLLQIDNSVLAIWRDQELYYIFDPFRRDPVGQVMDPDDYLTKGLACLQMHSNFESLSRNLYDKVRLMRRGGKFFIHGINVRCIKPLSAAAVVPNRYPKLKLEYPLITVPADLPPEPEEEPKMSPRGKPEKSESIPALPSRMRIPEFTSDDVVQKLIRDIVSEIVNEFPEPDVRRKRIYKGAERVLLKSDRSYLSMLKHDVLHKRDPDNIYTSQQSQVDVPRPVTLEEELRQPHNFELLPDGTWVIFGSSELPILQEDSMKLGGLLAGIVTTALSAKYKVSTWNADLVEYALEAVNSFGEEFEKYEPTLQAFLNQKLPRISIGSTTYEFEIRKVLHATEASSLRQLLLQSLICYNRLIVICQRFSCVIFKRNNFLYMFIGFACNPVGYRKFGPGPACMLRFIELDALIRRIEFGCDPHGCEITNYVVVAVKIRDVTTEPPERFRKMMSRDERELYMSEKARIKAYSRRRADKLRFLDDQLRKENKRIEEFLSEKKKHEEERAAGKVKEPRRQYSERSGEEEYEEEEYIPEYEEEAEEAIKKKHMRGKHLQKEYDDENLPRPVLYGYQMRQKDLLYKIQGTLAVPDRAIASVEVIKPCFFTSAVVVLYAMLRPLNQWPSSRIDHAVTTGAKIAGRVSNMTSACERIIKNITVDEYTFDIWVKSFETVNVSSSFKKRLEKLFLGRKYMLLQTSNTTYAIYHDEYFHLFDSYGSMDKTGKSEEEGEEESDRKKRSHGIKKYCERNTASWVLFADIESMVKYIDQRAADPNWRTKEEYKFHVVDIIQYKKAEPKERILQLLTDMEVAPTCGQFQDTVNNCARGETLEWLDSDGCLPVWSRMNRRNTAGRYRGVPITKAKKFDVEIDKRLWSIWGSLSPYAPVFASESRGKQFLACNVVACLAANLYRLAHWTPQLLDSIVISGDQYHRESLENIRREDYEFAMEDLGTECMLRDIRFAVHLEYVVMGRLYCNSRRQRMSLADALMYFFTRFEYGVLQCDKRSLAFGHTRGLEGGYFMFDCQSRDHPIFPEGQGAAYLLRTSHLQVLVYCIVITLNVPYYNVSFTLHQVEMLREGALVSAGEEESKPSDKNKKKK